MLDDRPALFSSVGLLDDAWGEAMRRHEQFNEPAPRGRNPRRMVGESYRDCVDRLTGELRAAEMDRDAALERARRAEAERDELREALEQLMRAYDRLVNMVGHLRMDTDDDQERADRMVAVSMELAAPARAVLARIPNSKDGAR